jgi:hypothetical protein
MNEAALPQKQAALERMRRLAGQWRHRAVQQKTPAAMAGENMLLEE